MCPIGRFYNNHELDIGFIQIRFLKKSAQYLGVYVENRPADYLYLCNRSVN